MWQVSKLNRILVDSSSSVDFLFKNTLDEIRIAYLKMEHTSTSLKWFGGWKLRPLGVVLMLVNIGMKLFEITIILDFMVVEEDNPY